MRSYPRRQVNEMDSTAIARVRRGSKRCSSTVNSTSCLCIATRRSKSHVVNYRTSCAMSACETRNCSTWFGSFRSEIWIANFGKFEKALSWFGIPCQGLLAALLGTATVFAVWPIYREEILVWLVRNNLQESILAEACVMLECISARIGATVWVRKKTSSVLIRVSQRTLNGSELQKLRRESPSVYDELMRRGSVRVDIPIDFRLDDRI